LGAPVADPVGLEVLEGALEDEAVRARPLRQQRVGVLGRAAAQAPRGAWRELATGCQGRREVLAPAAFEIGHRVGQVGLVIEPEQVTDLVACGPAERQGVRAVLLGEGEGDAIRNEAARGGRDPARVVRESKVERMTGDHVLEVEGGRGVGCDDRHIEGPPDLRDAGDHLLPDLVAFLVRVELASAGDDRGAILARIVRRAADHRAPHRPAVVEEDRDRGVGGRYTAERHAEQRGRLPQPGTPRPASSSADFCHGSSLAPPVLGILRVERAQFEPDRVC